MSYEVVSVDDYAKVDWSTHSLDLGIKRGDGQERWLPLDRTDLRILELLLSKSVLPGIGSAVSASPALKELCEWATAARQFAEKRGLP